MLYVFCAFETEIDDNSLFVLTAAIALGDLDDDESVAVIAIVDHLEQVGRTLSCATLSFLHIKDTPFIALFRPHTEETIRPKLKRTSIAS